MRGVQKLLAQGDASEPVSAARAPAAPAVAGPPDVEALVAIRDALANALAEDQRAHI